MIYYIAKIIYDSFIIIVSVLTSAVSRAFCIDGLNMHIIIKLAGTPPDWRYCQINSIIIDYREQSVLIEWVVWV